MDGMELIVLEKLASLFRPGDSPERRATTTTLRHCGSHYDGRRFGRSLHLADLEDPLWCACRRRVNDIEALQLFDVALTFVKDDLTTALVKDVKKAALFSHSLVPVFRVPSR